MEFEAAFGELVGNPRKHKSHTALRDRCCIDIKGCSCGSTQPHAGAALTVSAVHVDCSTREKVMFMWNLRPHLES